MRIIVIATLALLLTGCVPADPVVTPLPAPSSTPLFATDADALKAAEAAYAAYEAALDAAFATYDTSELSEYSSGHALTEAKAAVAKYIAKGQRQVGSTQIVSVSAEDLSRLEAPAGSESVGELYSCLDFSGVDVIDSSGHSVVGQRGTRSYSMEVGVKWDVARQKLLVTSEDVWSGKSVCNN